MGEHTHSDTHMHVMSDSGRLNLDICCNCGLDMRGTPIIPLLTSDYGIGVVCPDCLRGAPCVQCGGQATTTRFGLTYCGACVDSDSGRVVLDIDYDEDIQDVLELYGRENAETR
jgi:hypothetical protein